MITAIESVAVGDTNIEAVQRDGDVWVSVRRVCDVLEIDSANQRAKLGQKPWARTQMLTVRDAAGRAQPSFMIDLRSLPMWLATIDHTRVADNAIKRLIAFQTEAHDALAAHFFGPRRDVLSTSRPSGGAAGSGGVAGSGAFAELDALEHVNTMLSGLLRAARSTAAEVAEVRAMIGDNRAAIDAELAEARRQTAAAEENAARAIAVADRAIANSTMAREDRRRCDAAVNIITKAARGFAASRGDSYRDLYGKLRRALGLRPSSQGGKTLGESKLSASQVLVLSDTATRMGVPGVGAARIRAVLDGVDVVAPLPAPRVIPPRADDIEVKS